MTPFVSTRIRGTELDVDDQGTVVISVLEGRVAVENEFGPSSVRAVEQVVAEPILPIRKQILLTPEEPFYHVLRALPLQAAFDLEGALAIQKACEALAKEDKESGGKPLSIRIGINSGIFLAGNIGGRYFSDFTVHGVDVNLAKQMESLNKKYGTTILIGENTRALLTGAFDIQPAGAVAGRDNGESVTVYELKPL